MNAMNGQNDSKTTNMTTPVEFKPRELFEEGSSCSHSLAVTVIATRGGADAVLGHDEQRPSSFQQLVCCSA